MRTDKISEFLSKFEDQRLANLQAAAEDGKLVYHNCDACLLFHFQGNYSATKWEGEHASLARDAEAQFRDLGSLTAGNPGSSYWDDFTKPVEESRRKAILPLIRAEWEQRAAKKHAEVAELAIA